MIGLIYVPSPTPWGKAAPKRPNAPRDGRHPREDTSHAVRRTGRKGEPREREGLGGVMF